jgi:hypothetical protein
MCLAERGRGFSYGGADDHFKGSRWVIQNLADTVAKGGNFMVGIGPDRNGRFSPTAMNQLEEVGQWLKVNGEAIYETRPRPGDLWKEGEDVSFAESRPRKWRTACCKQREWPDSLHSPQRWTSDLRHLFAMAWSKTQLEDRTSRAKNQDHPARCKPIIEMARRHLWGNGHRDSECTSR